MRGALAMVALGLAATELAPMPASGLVSAAPGGSGVVSLRSLLALPPPVIGDSVNATPIRGAVYLLLPGQTQASPAKGIGFVPLTEPRQVPVGTVFDTAGGVVRLTTGTSVLGRTQSGDFGGGRFRVLQNRRQRGLTELALVVPANTKKICGTTRKQAQTASKRALPKTLLTLLHANVAGMFRTRGRFSSATVRGTAWTTSDRCDGTRTAVQRGVVVVFDSRTKREVTLHAHEFFLAAAPYKSSTARG
jgi:hypothetical protein